MLVERAVLLLALILACEVSFWVFIALGLTVRYPLNRPRLGLIFFAATPLIDLLLLVLTVLDLRDGGQPSWHHTLAAFYLGFSLVFGHQLIAWADRAYRSRVRGESVSTPQRSEWIEFANALGAAAIAVAAIELCLLAVGGVNAQAGDLRASYWTLGVVLVIWLVTGPLWRRRAPGPAPAPAPDPAEAHA